LTAKDVKTIFSFLLTDVKQDSLSMEKRGLGFYEKSAQKIWKKREKDRRTWKRMY
jgi:hypothetical protein